MLAEAVLRHARSYLSVHEEPPGSNDGPLIRQWLHNVGIDHPAPWCAAFVYSAYSYACGENQLPNPLPKTASALGMLRVPPYFLRDEPEPGCLAVFEHLDEKGEPDGHGHVCIVEHVQDHLVTTIDGNSDEKGSRTGGQVVRLTWDWRSGRRGRLHLKKFVVMEVTP